MACKSVEISNQFICNVISKHSSARVIFEVSIKDIEELPDIEDADFALKALDDGYVIGETSMDLDVQAMQLGLIPRIPMEYLAVAFVLMILLIVVIMRKK
jgi:hypothetical protein